MAIYSNLHDYTFANTNQDEDDIRGAIVYGADDEKLGKIDDVIFDNISGDLRYVVVDSGGWLTSKRFVVPARQLMIREEADKDFHLSLTKEQIQRLPEYREQEVESETHWTDYEHRYEAAWSDSPVPHREGRTHTVTPGTLAGAPGGEGKHHDSPQLAHDSGLESLGRQIDETIETQEEETGNAQMNRYSPPESRRIRDFQERLRREREEILRRRDRAA